MNESEIYHVIPLNDLREHLETIIPPCPCNPRIERENDSVICIHNSFDGREGLEMAKEILK